MPRKVYITSHMSIDDQLAEIAEEMPLETLCWPWFLTHADDWGRGKASAREILNGVFPALRKLVTLEVVENALDAFNKKGLLTLDYVNGTRYYQIREETWWRIQTHIKRSKMRDDKSLYPAITREQVRAGESEIPPSPSPSLSSLLSVDPNGSTLSSSGQLDAAGNGSPETPEPDTVPPSKASGGAGPLRPAGRAGTPTQGRQPPRTKRLRAIFHEIFLADWPDGKPRRWKFENWSEELGRREKEHDIQALMRLGPWLRSDHLHASRLREKGYARPSTVLGRRNCKTYVEMAEEWTRDGQQQKRPGMKPCSNCGGSGRTIGTQAPCPACKGTRFVPSPTTAGMTSVADAIRSSLEDSE